MDYEEPIYEGPRFSWAGLVVAILVGIQLVIAGWSGYQYSLWEQSGGGWGVVILLIVAWPIMFLVATGALFVGGLRRYRWAKILAFFIALTLPLQLRVSEDAFSHWAEREAFAKQRDHAIADVRREARRETREQRYAAMIRYDIKHKTDYEAILHRQERELREIFHPPHRIQDTNDLHLVLENGHGVKLFGMHETRSIYTTFKQFAENSIDNEVVIRLPDDFLESYVPGKGIGGSMAYTRAADSEGHRFGDVYALMFVDGELINLKYCKSEHREALHGYQQAYARGEL